jgi:hypothetical protein
MLHILHYARSKGFTASVIEAQVTVIPFYERLGYVAEGPEYDDGSGICTGSCGWRRLDAERRRPVENRGPARRGSQR